MVNVYNRRVSFSAIAYNVFFINKFEIIIVNRSTNK